MQERMRSAARSIAYIVDAEAHKKFRTQEEETEAPYKAQIESMSRMKNELDPNQLIKFVYTCIEKEGVVYFVLDITETGDADHDGKDDKAHIMEVYEEPSATLLEVFKTGVALVDQEPYQDRWGTFLSGYAPIFDSEKQLIGVVGVDISLTDYKQQKAGLAQVAIFSALSILGLSSLAGLGAFAYQRNLQRSVIQLVASGEVAMDAIRTKADFLAAMSHELRTPMNAVLGMAELLGETPLNSEQRSFVSTIQKSGSSLLGMLTNILDFSRLDEGSVGKVHMPFSLHTILDEMQSHFLEELKVKDLTMTVQHDPACPARFLGDAAHIGQIVRHLIENAIKFTDKGGVTVRAVLEDMPDGAAGLHFMIGDTGIGVPREMQNKLFQPFVQADGTSTRRHGGSGIGLAICKRICDALGGKIWMESEEGKGSLFHLLIPIEVATDAGGQTTPRVALIWSQDSVTGLMVSRVIEKQGHTPCMASTYEQLLKEIQHRQLDWLIMDAGLLHEEQLQELKKLSGKARLIVLNTEPGWMEDVSFDARLGHPLRAAELRRALEK
jgi:signal transduction histidine kinase